MPPPRAFGPVASLPSIRVLFSVTDPVVVVIPPPIAKFPIA
jgi:hypothetical protein